MPEEAEKIMKAYHADLSISSWGIRYAASLDGVMMVLSGMNIIEQVEDNTSYMKEFVSLNKEAKEIIQLHISECIVRKRAYGCGKRGLH